MRRAAKRDDAEPGIIAALEIYGCSVQQLSAPRVPDLLVGKAGVNILIEVKSEGAHHADKLQKAWADTWLGGKVFVVRSPEGAIASVRYAIEALAAGLTGSP